MKPAFVLLCYLAGNPAGTLHLANVDNCKYFKKRLAEQSIKIGDETQRYDCYCKLVNVNEQMRLW